MAGTGPAPEETRRRTNEPARGDWQPTAVVGWQHGDVPRAPARSKRAVRTWDIWFGAWFAAHWGPEDLPVLELTIKLWARADSGKATGSERSELRQLMDSCGITKKGQADRRWKPPVEDVPEQPTDDVGDETGPYGHLRVHDGGAAG